MNFFRFCTSGVQEGLQSSNKPANCDGRWPFQEKRALTNQECVNQLRLFLGNTSGRRHGVRFTNSTLFDTWMLLWNASERGLLAFWVSDNEISTGSQVSDILGTCTARTKWSGYKMRTWCSFEIGISVEDDCCWSYELVSGDSTVRGGFQTIAEIGYGSLASLSGLCSRVWVVRTLL